MMAIRMQYEDMDVTIKIPGYAGNHYIFDISGVQYHASPLGFSPNRIDFTIDHHNYLAWVTEDRENLAHFSTGGHIFQLRRHDLLIESVTASAYESAGHDSNHVTSPMPGKVIRINISEGDQVKKGDVLLIIEAMKMENLIVSPRDAEVKTINIAVNDRVESTTALVEFEE